MRPLYTTGEIAEQFGTNVQRIDYIIRTRKIRPTRTIANFRLYDLAGVDTIGEQIDLLEKEQGKRVEARLNKRAKA